MNNIITKEPIVKYIFYKLFYSIYIIFIYSQLYQKIS